MTFILIFAYFNSGLLDLSSAQGGAAVRVEDCDWAQPGLTEVLL